MHYENIQGLQRLYKLMFGFNRFGHTFKEILDVHRCLVAKR